MRARDVALSVGSCRVLGDPGREVVGLSAISTPRGGSLTWARTAESLRLALEAGLQGVTVITSEPVPHTDAVTQVVVTIDPRLAFALASAVLHPGLAIGVHPAAVVYDCVTMGRNVEVRAGAVIGAPGFGYVRDPSGALVPFPQIGRVLIEDDVSIGSGTAVDRGALTDTVIRRGVKIDNLVHIAHGVDVGEHTLIVATAEVSGSVRIGRRCQIGPGACIREGVTIGDDVQVGIGAIVLHDVPDGSVVVGNPAESLGTFHARRQRLRQLLRE